MTSIRGYAALKLRKTRVFVGLPVRMNEELALSYSTRCEAEPLSGLPRKVTRIVNDPFCCIGTFLVKFFGSFFSTTWTCEKNLPEPIGAYRNLLEPIE